MCNRPSRLSSWKDDYEVNQINLTKRSIKLCQFWTGAQHFGDFLHLHHEGNDVMVDRYLMFFYTQLMAPLVQPLANGEQWPNPSRNHWLECSQHILQGLSYMFQTEIVILW
jgi:hypothetical protein